MNAGDKKQLNVRIPIELYEKVEHDNKPKVELISEALNLYFTKAIKKDSNIINDDSTELSFSKELEFHNWFADNYVLFGFDRIIKQSTRSYPDFILEKDNREIKVELETLASNFNKHKHDPSLVDIVICLEKDTELPVDTLELPFKFNTKTSKQTTIRIDDELEKKIDEQRGEKSKSDFYRMVLTEYANNMVTANSRTMLIEQLTGQVRFLEGKLDEANRLLLNEQTLHLTTQRMLPPAQKKTWYQFWK